MEESGLLMISAHQDTIVLAALTVFAAYGLARVLYDLYMDWKRASGLFDETLEADYRHCPVCNSPMPSFPRADTSGRSMGSAPRPTMPPLQRGKATTPLI